VQGAIAPADRKFLWAAAAVAALLLGGTVALAPPVPTGRSPVPSSYSHDAGGALAAYLLLGDLHYNAHRWQQPPAELAAHGAGVLLILAGPTETPTDREREALHAFVRRGGRILFCGARVAEFFKEAAVVREFETSDVLEYPAALPSRYSRGAPTVTIQPEALWERLGPKQVSLYGDAEKAAVVAWRMGEGEVVWWAGATPLTNAGMRRGSNLRVFLNAMGTASTIYWDEYFHGQRPSLWAYAQNTPAPLALAQLALLLLAVLFTFSRRWGPVIRPAAISRLSPLEFVETLGGLYQRARATPVAVEIVCHRLRDRLTRQLALPAATPDEELAKAAETRLGWPPGELRTALARASAPPAMRSRQALELIRQLESYTVRLGVQPARPKKID
jgi:hypothetical protein